ncbi:Lrp/AsnC ligand binding domain-containing protein [Streptomyces sp. NPDC050658]|uniref:Lrp/AsnC ligand binding domain-containing protein n=1 Tax=unclassified Streptomyces TaxID=2593676 RepID=UPI00342FAA06
MVRTYVLVQTEIGKAAAMAAEIAAVQGVVRADDVTGPYDVIVTAEATSVELLGQIVARIQAIEGITRTHACPALKDHRPRDWGHVDLGPSAGSDG